MKQFEKELKELYNICENNPSIYSIVKLHEKHLSELSSLKEAEKDDVQEFMNDVHKWADDTFGKERTALAPLHHLKKEVDEAINSMINENDSPSVCKCIKTIEELADCFILILNSSSKYGLTFDVLLEASKQKMIKNKSRQWGKADENGVVEHIEAEAEKEVSEWISIEDKLPEPGFEVLLFNKKWINEDWNLKGIRIGYLDDVCGWVSAYWCNNHDEYHTRFSTEDDNQFTDFEGENQIPTHWMEIKAHRDNLKKG